jgi:hypothetical protein
MISSMDNKVQESPPPLHSHLAAALALTYLPRRTLSLGILPLPQEVGG